MKCHIYDNESRFVEIIEATPICGEDFCEDCGDCLYCYGEFDCPVGSNREHFWVKYEDDKNTIS